MQDKRYIICGNAPTSGIEENPDRDLRLRLWGKDGPDKITLRIEDIHKRMSKDVPDSFQDLLEIATHANIATHQAKTIQSTPANIARVREVQGYLKLPNGILDLLCSELDSNEQLLFLHLYRLTRGFNKDSVIISLAKIEQRVKFSERTIQKTLTSLEQKGLVKRIGYKFGGDGTKGMVIWVVEIATPANSATVAKNTIPANSADIKDPKDLKEIIKNILSLNKNGNYKISDLAELVKGVCAKEGIRFDNDTFNEMVRRRG